MSYLDKLRNISHKLRTIMQAHPLDHWKGLYVDYHKPHVERLWLQYTDDIRINLHRIHLCGREEALYHPHPWPSAIYLVSGYYEQCLGYGNPGVDGIMAVREMEPPKIGPMILNAGSMYEMSSPNEWHYVRPLFAPSLSLMITGKPFKSGGQKMDLRPLEDPERTALWSDFERVFKASI